MVDCEVGGVGPCDDNDTRTWIMNCARDTVCGGAAAGAARPAAADQAHRQEDEVPVPFRSQWDRIEAAFKPRCYIVNESDTS